MQYLAHHSRLLPAWLCHPVTTNTATCGHPTPVHQFCTGQLSASLCDWCDVNDLSLCLQRGLHHLADPTQQDGALWGCFRPHTARWGTLGGHGEACLQSTYSTLFTRCRSNAALHCQYCRPINTLLLLTGNLARMSSTTSSNTGWSIWLNRHLTHAGTVPLTHRHSATYTPAQCHLHTPAQCHLHTPAQCRLHTPAQCCLHTGTVPLTHLHSAAYTPAQCRLHTGTVPLTHPGTVPLTHIGTVSLTSLTAQYRHTTQCRSTTMHIKVSAVQNAVHDQQSVNHWRRQSVSQLVKTGLQQFDICW